MRKLLLKPLSLVLVALPFILSSCGEDTPIPTIDFTYEADGHEVTFASTATDVDSYSWDFGDNTVSTETNPVHTYEAGGDYQVTCTVVGGGGDNTVTKTVNVPMIDADYLVGTWKLDETADINTSKIDGSDPNAMPKEFLPAYSMGDVYEDEFTFNADGTMSIDTKNGMVFGSIINAAVKLGALTEDAIMEKIIAGEITLPIDPSSGDMLTDFGICTFKFTVPNGGTWEVSSEDLVVNEGTELEVTLSGNHIKFADGYYLGLYNNKTEVIIKEATATKLVVQVLLNGELSVAGIGTSTHLFELTFVHP